MKTWHLGLILIILYSLSAYAEPEIKSDSLNTLHMARPDSSFGSTDTLMVDTVHRHETETARPGFANKADSLYAMRAVGFDSSTGLVDSTIINQAIREYHKMLMTGNTAEDVQKIIWKLMQCYYYKGNYTTADKDRKKKIFDKGIEIGEETLRHFPDSPGVHFWMGILWGYWSEQVGLLTAGRKGVAGKIRDHAEKLIRIDDTFADGGAYRTLARLHFKAPKIPIILNWPSKKKSITYFEKAYAINSRNLYTKQYYAEALYDAGEKKKALQMMREIINTDTTVHGIAEDAFIKREAKAFLRTHKQ